MFKENAAITKNYNINFIILTSLKVLQLTTMHVLPGIIILIIIIIIINFISVHMCDGEP